jgi:NADPH2:quinone reductase
MGRDGAGVIEKIVEDPQNPISHDLKVGDPVAYFVSQGPGSYADYTVVSLNHVVKIPSPLSFDDGAASMVQGLTGIYSQ